MDRQEALRRFYAQSIQAQRHYRLPDGSIDPNPTRDRTFILTR